MLEPSLLPALPTSVCPVAPQSPRLMLLKSPCTPLALSQQRRLFPGSWPLEARPTCISASLPGVWTQACVMVKLGACCPLSTLASAERRAFPQTWLRHTCLLPCPPLSFSGGFGRLLEASSRHCLVGAGVFLPQCRRQAGPLVPWVTRVQLECVLCVSEHPTGLGMAQHDRAGLTVSFMVKIDPCLLREVVL